VRDGEDATASTRDACATQPTDMPAIAETFSLGLPVDIGRIDHELKKLWQEKEGAVTRASLMNLAVYSEESGSLNKNTQLMAKITEDHACRAIVIEADCNAAEDRVDSDLPFYLWWQEEFREPMDSQLWAWVDRVIYDSQGWKDFPAQMRLMESAEQEAKQRIVLCDLNWTRLDNVRFALAQFFDHPASHHHFAKIGKLRIDFAPRFRSTAVLFVGWLASQLNWRAEKEKSSHELRFVGASGSTVDIELRERDGEPIHEVALTTGEVEFLVTHAKCGDLLEVSRGGPGEKRMPQLMPAGKNDPVGLMSEELMRGGPHHVYLNAVNCVRDLL
jgi:glucose-6-phosphate dehydrogenase assembly protein OpcA